MAGKILETNLKMAAETGENQLVVIFDMEGFDIKQYASRPGNSIVGIYSILNTNWIKRTLFWANLIIKF